MLITYLYVFIASIFIGSFFGVMADRIYRGEQFVSGRSYCEKCKHPLAFLDLIPLFSYLFLNGKCRYCKKPLSKWLPIGEIFTASVLTVTVYVASNPLYTSLFAYKFINFPYPFDLIPQILVAVLIASVLILIFITDAKYMVIPDVYLYLFGVLAPLYLIFFKLDVSMAQNILIVKDHLFAGLVLGIFFAALHYGSRKRAMGDGDIYLAGIIGLYLGSKLSLVMWFMAFLTGAVFGVILLLTRKKKMKSAVPFGPFLLIGMVIALFFGSDLLNWYLSI